MTDELFVSQSPEALAVELSAPLVPVFYETLVGVVSTVRESNELSIFAPELFRDHISVFGPNKTNFE